MQETLISITSRPIPRPHFDHYNTRAIYKPSTFGTSSIASMISCLIVVLWTMRLGIYKAATILHASVRCQEK